MMRELVIDSLNLWVTVPDYFDMDWYLTVRMTIEARFMMTIEIGYCYMQYKYMRYWSVLDVTIYWAVARLIIVFMLLKVTGKRLFDRNTLYSPIVHCIHGYCYRSLLLILFTVYTITDLLLLYCYRYCHRIVPVL